MTEEKKLTSTPVRRQQKPFPKKECESQFITKLGDGLKEHYDRVLDEELPANLQKLVEKIDAELANTHYKRK